MKLYLRGPRSLAAAEGMSLAEARRIWAAANRAIIYQGAGRVGLVLFACVLALAGSQFIGSYCGAWICLALELTGLAIAFLLFPCYMQFAVSRRAREMAKDAAP